jgi:hypothetical protein
MLLVMFLPRDVFSCLIPGALMAHFSDNAYQSRGGSDGGSKRCNRMLLHFIGRLLNYVSRGSRGVFA